MFQNHTLTTLRNICREYNTFNKIKNYSTLKKKDLIDEMKKHLLYNQDLNQVESKDKQVIFQVPYSKKQDDFQKAYNFFKSRS